MTFGSQVCRDLYLKRLWFDKRITPDQKQLKSIGERGEKCKEDNFYNHN